MLKRQLIIDDSHSLVLSDLPYYSGQKLTVIVLVENELQQRLLKWKTFFKQIQATPAAQNITDDEIAAEIEAYRHSS
jgi:hypothetical protein